MQCKNCFQPIADLRKESKCDACASALHKDCAIKDGGTFCDVCYTLKAETPIVIQHKIPDVIRRTYIETYRSCPHKFLKEVIEGNEQPPTSYTQLGIDLHEMFDNCSNDFYEKESMISRYNSMFDLYTMDLFDNDDRQRRKMFERGLTCIDNFYKTLPTLPDKPFVTEQTIFFDVGDDLPKVRFTMDRIDKVDGELEMHDWKTGKTMVGTKLSSDLQAPLYIYGSRLHYDLPIRSFTFHYLNEGKTRTFTRSDINPDVYECVVRKRTYQVNLTDTIREIQSIFAQIVKGNYNIPRDTDKMYFTCKMCHIKQMGLCSGAETESWVQNSNPTFGWG